MGKETAISIINALNEMDNIPGEEKEQEQIADDEDDDDDDDDDDDVEEVAEEVEEAIDEEEEQLIHMYSDEGETQEQSMSILNSSL